MDWKKNSTNDNSDLKQLLLSMNKTLQELHQKIMPPTSSPEEREKRKLEESVPLYVITPTYPRMTELSEITRTGQVLKVLYSKWCDRLFVLFWRDSGVSLRPNFSSPWATTLELRLNSSTSSRNTMKKVLSTLNWIRWSCFASVIVRAWDADFCVRLGNKLKAPTLQCHLPGVAKKSYFPPSYICTFSISCSY